MQTDSGKKLFVKAKGLSWKNFWTAESSPGLVRKVLRMLIGEQKLWETLEADDFCSANQDLCKLVFSIFFV